MNHTRICCTHALGGKSVLPERKLLPPLSPTSVPPPLTFSSTTIWLASSLHPGMLGSLRETVDLSTRVPSGRMRPREVLMLLEAPAGGGRQRAWSGAGLEIRTAHVQAAPLLGAACVSTWCGPLGQAPQPYTAHVWYR
jgi:hypothetical protein